MSDDTSSHVRVSHLYDELLYNSCIILLCVFTQQNLDAVKSGVSTSSSSSSPSSSMHPAYRGQYQLAYEMEKLTELRRQVAAQEERLYSMQQQLEQVGNGSDAEGWNFCFLSLLSAYTLAGHNWTKVFIIWDPVPPIDHIRSVMIVWRIRVKIIWAVLCCIVYLSCAQL